MATKVERPEPVPEIKELEQPADMEIEVTGEDVDDDLYTRLKTLQRQLEFFEIQARTLLCAQTLRAALALQFWCRELVTRHASATSSKGQPLSA